MAGRSEIKSTKDREEKMEGHVGLANVKQAGEKDRERCMEVKEVQ